MQDPQAVIAATRTEGTDQPLASATSFEAAARSVARQGREIVIYALCFYIYALMVCALFLSLPIVMAYGEAYIITLALKEKLNLSGVLICLSLQVVAFSVLSTLLIIIGLIPRHGKFTPSGPRLDPTDRPVLHRFVAEVAGEMKVKAPDEVFAIWGMGAYCAERRGFMGAARDRVLALGLPLFATYNAAQFRSLVAHELAYFYRGPGRLRAGSEWSAVAVLRSADFLSEAAYAPWVNMFFIWYRDLLLEQVRLFRAAQEALADQFAARVAGSKAHIDTIKLHGAACDAFTAYWEGTAKPLALAGVRVPLLEGFRRYLAKEEIAGSVERIADHLLEEEGARPYEYPFDVYPTLPERIAAMSQLGYRDEDDRSPSAMILLGNPEPLEVELFYILLGKEKASGLKFVLWERLIEQGYMPIWRSTVRDFSPGLEGITPETLPEVVKNLNLFGMKLLQKSGKRSEMDSGAAQSRMVIGAALALTLDKAGWQLHTSPGDPVYALRDGSKIEPFEVLGRLMTGKISADEWRKECAEAGIAGVDLGLLEPSKPT